jgi:hypothetical protein
MLYSENLEATPRIELGMEVLQFAPSLSTKCNERQVEYEPSPVESTRYKGMKGVRQRIGSGRSAG